MLKFRSLKPFSTLFFVFLIFGMAFLVPTISANFQPPSPPAPAITITNNGEVTPSNLGLNRVGTTNTYAFSQDIIGYTIIVEKDNVVINGDGHTLQGSDKSNLSDSVGVYLKERSKITIRNLTITDFNYGIQQSPLLYGDSPDYTMTNTISGNTITHNNYGIYITDKSSNTITQNNISGNVNGIFIRSPSHNNTLKENHLENNTYSLSFHVTAASDGYNDVDTTNTVDGKPVIYWINQNNKQPPADAGYLALVNCTHIAVEAYSVARNGQGLLLVDCSQISVQDSNFTANSQGILMVSVSESTIAGTILAKNLNAIYLSYCSRVSIMTNEITESTYDSVYLTSSADNSITNNNLRSNGLGGISSDQVIGSSGKGAITLYYSTNNTLSHNVIESNGEGINLHSSNNTTIVSNILTLSQGTGIYVYVGEDNNIAQNAITDNRDWGIKLFATTKNSIHQNHIADNSQGILVDDSYKNRITENNITENQGWGMQFTGHGDPSNEHNPGASNNDILRNNFIDNQKGEGLDVSIPSLWVYPQGTIPGSGNAWDDGREGNYWSDYETRYPNAAQVPGAGIWDTTWIINENNADHCPLVAPYGTDPSPETQPTPTPEQKTSPTMQLVSPQQTTYNTSSVALTFTVNQPADWMGYSLDGQANVTVNGNTTLAELQNGAHTIVVFARNLEGIIGRTGTYRFTVQTEETQPQFMFPAATSHVVLVVAVCIAFVCAVLIYRRKTNSKDPNKIQAA